MKLALTTLTLTLGIAVFCTQDAQAGSRSRVAFDVHFGFDSPRVASTCRSYPKGSHERVWVRGHYEYRYRTVHVPGRWVTVSEPVRRTVRSYGTCGESVRVSHERRRVWQPARTERVKDRVWIPGYWTTRNRGYRTR